MPTLRSHNPMTGEVVYSGACAAADDVRDAVAAVRRAQREWSRRPHNDRVAILRRFQQLARDRVDDLAKLLTREAGKVSNDALAEAKLLPAKVDATLAAWERKQVAPFEAAPGVTARLRWKPIGTLAVFGPFNFPMHLPNGHLGPALLAGNACVFKPSEHTPACGEALVALFHEAGVPRDVLRVVHGGRDVGEALVDSDVDGVLFTGSERAGDAIARRLRYDQLLALELGGNNPLVVHNPTDVDAAIEVVIQSAFVSSGQRCTCARRLIVTDHSPTDLIDRLAAAIRAIPVGAPDADPAPLVGPLITHDATLAALAAHQRLLDSGATAIVPMEPLDAGAEAPGRCSGLLRPGLLDVTTCDAPDEEIFAPLLQLIRVPTLDAAIEEANNTRFGLAAGILTRHRDAYEGFASEVDAGCINWNRPTTGASGQLPFGGTKRSGNHHPAGSASLDYCMTPLASLESG